MHVILTAELAGRVADAVACGRFSDASEAVAEALRLMFRMSDSAAESDEMDDLPLMSAAKINESLRRSADDIANGRTVAAETVLEWMDSQIAEHRARTHA